jgi:DegV family protein with EDD domain
MDKTLQGAFATGYERLAAWSDLLDDINLFPVADADTGRNLRISLASLRNAGHTRAAHQLLTSATGNSGNIAAAFFSEFIRIKSDAEIGPAVTAGHQSAWKALLDPKPGTMLTVFDALVEAVDHDSQLSSPATANIVIQRLKAAVLSTAQILPALKQAGVVDSGALGLFLFFEGFIKHLAQQTGTFCSPNALFGNKLIIDESAAAMQHNAYCIDTIVQMNGDARDRLQEVAALGESVIALPDQNQLKIHFHTDSSEAAKRKLADLGAVVSWSQEKIEVPGKLGANPDHTATQLHIVTDAAGSLTKAMATQLGITLLDSYLVIGDRHVPETLVAPETLYAAMRAGTRVTTAQASTFERHQCYQNLVDRHERILYLCVGSVYTGNYDIATQWCAKHVNNGRMIVIDSTAASGRLALIAMSLARAAKSGRKTDQIVQNARAIIEQCEELIFLDRLKYLAAGGRISKTRGFLGDLINLKPVISPKARGAEKVGVVKNKIEQLRFAWQQMQKRIDPTESTTILLQYTDNRQWIESEVKDTLSTRFPKAQIAIHPMSLTSGAHMGPGTWAVAYIPDSAIGPRGPQHS